MSNSNYQIRSMTREELKIPLEWAAKEGWNPGLFDTDAFYAADPHGFFMGFFKDEPISAISAVKYSQDYGFIGLYIVKPKYRQKGYGIKIWNHAIDYLSGCNIGLDGVVAAQDKYKRFGFTLYYRNIRYEGKSKNFNVKDNHIVFLSKIPFEKLKSYDDKLFSISRSQFLEKWIRQPESLAVGYFENKKLKGYGMIRKCQIGYKIGPLFADNKEIAEKIFQKLNSFLDEGTLFYLDTPEKNKEALKLAKRYDMKSMFETARMYSKKQPKINLQKVFGVTTFELG